MVIVSDPLEDGLDDERTWDWRAERSIVIIFEEKEKDRKTIGKFRA